MEEDIPWENLPRKIDPDFKGSMYEVLGFIEQLCPTCGAHLYKNSDGRVEKIICLNGCHFPGVTKAKAKVIAAIVDFENAVRTIMDEIQLKGGDK